MAAPKKWSLILSEIEGSIPICETAEDCKLLLNRFESVDIEYRNKNAHFYLMMWKIAKRSGKLNIASEYIQKSLEYLINLKRIPQIKILIQDLLEAGHYKKEISEAILINKILSGKDNTELNPELKYIEILSQHPEAWKKSPSFLKQFLALDQDWKINHWKLCYEQILFHHFDKILFLILFEKSIELKKENAEIGFLELFKSKKINLTKGKNKEKLNDGPIKENLHLDYDQIAMDLLSGLKEPNIEDQNRVINSLKFISEEELKIKGSEMIVAFELLGMEQVVIVLCEKVLKIQTEPKARASSYYIWVQSLCNLGEYYKAIELINEVLDNEPVFGDELIAFIYLKAEAFLKLKKNKNAKELYIQIQKTHQNYRLVKERLKTIETT
jgi:tetratricopeptide (TPR) repeat protein